MSFNSKQYNKKGNVPVSMIIGFSILFTPLFFVGIILIIGSIIAMYKKKQESGEINVKEVLNDLSNLTHENKSLQYVEKDSPERHIRNHEPTEKMTKEDRENYKKYSNLKNSYEQTVIPIRVKRNNSNTCEICRNVRTKNTSYCKVCGELFEEGLKCTFCKTKNELTALYCKNCGVRFKK